MEIISLFVSLVSFILVIGLRERVSRIERRLTDLNNSSVRPEAAAPVAYEQMGHVPSTPGHFVSPLAGVYPTAGMGATPAPQMVQEPGFDFVAWLQKDWMVKLGAVLILIAMGWFVSYAFLNNWIGPTGRIVCGISFGVALLILGYWRIQTWLSQGSIFLVLGASTILLTVYAARSVYDMFTPLSALTFMFFTSAFVAFVAMVYKSRGLGVASILLAAFAPTLTDSPTVDYIGLFSYLACVVVGALSMYAWRGYTEVTFAAFLAVAFYSLTYLMGGGGGDERLLIFAYGFAALFFFAHLVDVVKNNARVDGSGLLMAVGNSLMLLLWIYRFVQPEWQSLITATWTIVFLTGAFVAYQRTSRRGIFFLYAGIGVAYLAAATAFELSGSALVIAYALESAVAVLLVLFLTKNVSLAEKTSLLMFGPICLSLGSIVASEWRRGVLHEHFFVLVSVMLALGVVGAALYSLRHSKEQKGDVPAGAVHLIGASLFAYTLVWLIFHATQPRDTAVLFSLVVYTVVGIASYFAGYKEGLKTLRLYGAAVLLGVVARLLLVDVWSLALAGRIITFFTIGILFLATAFLTRREHGQAVVENNK